VLCVDHLPVALGFRHQVGHVEPVMAQIGIGRRRGLTLGEHGAAQDRAGYNKQGDDDHGNGGLLVTPS
jgi:hypothetical protein